jgi:NAD(P)H-hydrate epimerase
MPIPVLSPEQSDAWDRQAETAGVPRSVLMNAAGRAVAQIVAARLPLAMARGVLVAAGSGNNGGDGWVAARAFHRAGVAVWVAAGGGEPGPLCAEARRLALADGVREVAADGPWPAVGLAIDALLGTGARGAPRPPIVGLVERLADLAVPVVAVDGPTGLDLATGVVHGVAPAALSITFGGLRRGHLLGRDDAGDVVVADIGHPNPPADWPTLVSDAAAAAEVPPLPADAHKGTRGRVVVVGGDTGMAGAARMVARAAFATGAGLVHVACPADTVRALQAAEPDVQTVEQEFASPPSPALLDLVARADAVVLGPGLGRGAGRRDFVTAVMARARRVVLDADGLIALQGGLDVLRRRSAERPCVLTPHPGEFRALWPERAGAAETDPWGAAESAARAAGVGCVVLLKGVPTVVASDGRAVMTVAAGNPGLATGGSGDLLSGIIGCLLAQGRDAPLAAAAAAQALGRAADIAARRHTARAMRPVDVVRALPDLWREWEVLRRAPRAPAPPVLLELPAPARV